MKKVIYNSFGDENVLQIVEQQIAAPGPNQVLIKVKAVSINPLDWKIYRGEQKLMSGSKFPKSIGIDFSGIVEQPGAQASRFKKGDEVMGVLNGFKDGALAEYLVINENDVAGKPANVNFEAAAALPLTGLSALQIIDQLAGITEGQEVLINGGTGGIGVFAIQIAKIRGARITAVVGSRGMAEAANWGAENVIDYNKQNILQLNKKFDVVIDLSTKLTFKAAKPLMKHRAVFITTLPSPLTLAWSFINNLFSGKKLKVLLFKPSIKGFDTLKDLAEKGLIIVLDKTYHLDQVRNAYRESSRGKTFGKSVILID
jgi:NADPH:quinone reductase-like Zn-dependent oxidoreductase